MAFANRLTFCTVLAGLSLTSANAQWYAFDIHPGGNGQSAAYGGRGDLMVGLVDPTNNIQYLGEMWVNGAAQDLVPAGSTKTLLRRTDGTDIVGYATFNGVQCATAWFGQGILWANLAPRRSVASALYDLDAGRQVGYYRNSTGGNMAAIWSGTASSVVNLHPGGMYTDSYARGISGNIQVGAATTAGHEHAGRWYNTSSTFLDMQPSGFNSSIATDVDGDLACGFAFDNSYGVFDDGTQAHYWDVVTGTPTNIHPGGFSTSKAYGINSGLAVGYMCESGGNPRAVLWNIRSGTLIDLQTVLDNYSPFYTGSVALDVWYEGDYVKVCGYGVDLWSNQAHAVMWMGLL